MLKRIMDVIFILCMLFIFSGSVYIVPVAVQKGIWFVSVLMIVPIVLSPIYIWKYKKDWW